MKTYYIIRTVDGQQQTYHKSLKEFVLRDESDGFARRYKSRAAAVRRAKLLKANVVEGKQWLDIFNQVFTQPGQSFAEEFVKFVKSA